MRILSGGRTAVAVDACVVELRGLKLRAMPAVANERVSVVASYQAENMHGDAAGGPVLLDMDEPGG